MSDTPRIQWNPTVIAYMVVVHVLAVSAFFLPWPPYAVPVIAGLYGTIMLGTTVGLHRLISHRAFRCPRWVEYGLVTAAMLSGQHARSDLEGDVHSPTRGFWYSHLCWILDDASTAPEAWRTLCRDFAEDRYYQWLLRYRMVPQLVLVGVLCLTLGWSALPACFFLPLVLWMHGTYTVNSVCHMEAFGSRDHETRDLSRNVWWVSIVALGEGWHNNHHAWPASARHGWVWWQFDPGWLFIRLLERLGLAWDVHVPKQRAPETPVA
jgi:stearoyl-CoA desaturase (delta-9 desaturase)